MCLALTGPTLCVRRFRQAGTVLGGYSTARRKSYLPINSRIAAIVGESDTDWRRCTAETWTAILASSLRTTESLAEPCNHREYQSRASFALPGHCLGSALLNSRSI